MLVTTTRGAAGRDDAALPLLIVLPWSRSTPAELLSEVGYTEIDAPARVIAIEGFEPDRGGFSFWVRTRPAPTDPEAVDVERLELVAARASRLAALFARLRAHFHTYGLPVVSGVSQGADLSLALALHHRGSVAAALPVAARASVPPPAGQAVPPIDAFHGMDDAEAAPFLALARAVALLRAQGVPIVLHAYPGVRHEIGTELRRDLLACAAARLGGSHLACGARARP